MPQGKDALSLCVKVEIGAGVEVKAAALDMLDLSRKLNCGITADFNGTMIFCYPHNDVDEIVERWNMMHYGKHQAEKRDLLEQATQSAIATMDREQGSRS